MAKDEESQPGVIADGAGTWTIEVDRRTEPRIAPACGDIRAGQIVVVCEHCGGLREVDRAHGFRAGQSFRRD